MTDPLIADITNREACPLTASGQKFGPEYRAAITTHMKSLFQIIAAGPFYLAVPFRAVFPREPYASTVNGRGAR
jgi:hypothetical protein